MCGGYKKGENPSSFGKNSLTEKTMDNRLPAGLRGRVIFGKGNKVTIGDRIRRIRKKRRLTQAELAMMSGLSLSAIQGYEQGRYEPKRKSLERIAEVFKIPVEELYITPAELGTNLAEVGTDCISREQAIDAVVAETIYTKEELKEYYEANSHRNEWVNGIYDAVEAIKQLPPIQPKRGRWISADAIFGGVPFYCSECGENTRDTVMGKPRWNFCPNCGADMRGEQDG